MNVPVVPALAAAVLAFLPLTLAPVRAQDASALGCWDATGAPGLFDWKSSPSIACRDAPRGSDAPQPAPGATVSLGTTTAAGTTATANGGRGGDGPVLSFSGNAYVGLGLKF